MEYPYVLSVDKFNDLLGRLENIGVPDKFDHKYLASLGYTSSNDRKFIQVLRFLDLVDNKNSQPTDAYQKVFRGGKEGQLELARILREKYSDLYKVYPDAHRKDAEALLNYFRANTKLGNRALQAVVATFKTMCSRADFEGTDAKDAYAPLRDDLDYGEDGGKKKDEQSERKDFEIGTLTRPLSLNVNIQLELPATSDADVYEALFASMARHVLQLTDDE